MTFLRNLDYQAIFGWEVFDCQLRNMKASGSHTQAKRTIKKCLRILSKIAKFFPSVNCKIIKFE